MNHRIIFGRGTVNQLGHFLKSWGCSRVLMVTGKQSFDRSIKKNEIESTLKGFTVMRYCDFDVNPVITDLYAGMKIVSDFDPEAIVGIGGGSVMDTAKLLSVLPIAETEMTAAILGKSQVPDRTRHLVLIPTTAGSGSEATHFAVVYKDKEKYSVGSSDMLPDLAILDPAFTDTMSGELTAITGFDAFCQAIESFWSVGATKESITFASESIKIIRDVFSSVVDNASPYDRDKMMKASFLAGKAINISKTTGPHSLSYALTKNFGIPHGLAAILTLSAFFEYNTTIYRTSLNEVIEVNEYIGRIAKLYRLIKVKNTAEAMNRITKMIEHGGFRNGLRNYGINDNSDLKLLCESVNFERLNNNPVKLDKNDLISILKKSY